MNLDTFQDSIGYRFHDPDLLRLALTHPSAARKLKDNQRLEFLGDAVLQIAISRHLFNTCPKEAEGSLTAMRAEAVNRKALSQLARRIDLGAVLILGRGEERNHGRDKDSNLADTLEALIGAIFQDGGFETACEWVVRHYTISLSDEAPASFNPKGDLQEWLQGRGLPTPEYRVTEESGPDHSKHYRVVVISDGNEIGSGEGTSKKEAEQAAAQEALITLVKA